MLTREELERDLVRRDRQSMISDCLKLFDTNQGLVLQIEAYVDRLAIVEATITGQKVEIERLRARKWIKVLNMNIEQKVEKIRTRNRNKKLRRQAR